MSRVRDNSREHASSLRNKLIRAIGVLEVQGRVPIDRLVLGYRTRRAVTVDDIVVSSGLGKA
jgi:hypothetical protein